MRYRYDHASLQRVAFKSALPTTEVARAAGLTRQAVADIVRGVRVPKASTLACLASAWGVSPGTFFTREP